MLNFWIISSLFCCIIIITTGMAIKSQLKREGYTVIEKKKSFAEQFLGCIQSLFVYCVPFVNIIIAIYVLFSYEKIYKGGVERLLKLGHISKPE